jgi:hypothetical protein
MLKSFALVLGLLLCCNLTQAQVGAVDSNRVPGPLPEVRHPALPDFSLSERAAINRAVSENSGPAAVPFDLEIKIGTILPESVHLALIPESVVTEIPAATNYSSAVWRDQVLLVHPKTRAVADILRGYILRDQSH